MKLYRPTNEELAIQFAAADKYIRVYQTHMGDWKACMFWKNPEMGGFWEPWETSDERFDTKNQADMYAKFWGKDSGIRLGE